MAAVSHRAVGWLASWNAWSWRPTDSSVPNYWYLTGLLFLAIFFALVRALTQYAMNAAAARAALAVSTRLRRALYHHTYRLGTLAIQSTGPSRAAALFHRHVDAIANAVHEQLTFAVVRSDWKSSFLLVFALVIHFWLAVAFLLMAVIVLWSASRCVRPSGGRLGKPTAEPPPACRCCKKA